MPEIAKTYNPTTVEDRWYEYWEKNRIFHSEIDPTKQPYTIVIPPPNITGMLTMGHILNNTIQDILIRMKRMQGYNACWVPGTDHASIATETKVVKHLKDKGIEKDAIGREKFLEHCQEWKGTYGGIIIQQLRKLGVSCDWERERFTMDDHYYKKVIETFVELYNEGKIYRGYRMVNWDPSSKSAISDEEVLFRQVNGKLWYFKYPVKDSKEFVIVATTRPETMLGDSGVAVNPTDERYQHLIGKTLCLPLTDREIPVFADEYVDPAFGTGAVKVTPAHDFNDHDMGKRHGLEFINIFHPNAVSNDNVPAKYRNLDRYDLRKLVVEDMQAAGLVEKIEDYQNNVGYSERGNVPIEPYMSEQWFMKMDELARPALEAVQKGEIRFHPSHWVKTYEHWMNGIKDWCISRQLWWGHRIPVWYHNETKEVYCSVNPPENPGEWTQDKDVLDTWASSWLWAYDVFETDEEQKYYYPTDALVTAPDIIFFWVARMIIAGLHFKKAIPFRDVYFTSIIRDSQGRKMSKSLGNSPDPLEVIAEYGADALRFTMMYLAPLGQDVLFSTDRCEFGRNFANKIWNAARFLMMNAESISYQPALRNDHKDLVDFWMESKLHRTLKDIQEAMDRFEINNASKIIYSLVWNDFCDWFVELSKIKFNDENPEVRSAALTRAIDWFGNILQVVHPFMPFITEEVWHLIQERGENNSISTSKYPEYQESLIDLKAEQDMEGLQDIITAIRNIRGEKNIPMSKPIIVHIKTSAVSERVIPFIKKLTKASEVIIGESIVVPEKSATTVIRLAEIFIPLEGLIDTDAERKRIEKEIQRLEGLLFAVEKKLSNEGFVAKAPAEVIEKERAKQTDWKESIEKLKIAMNSLGA